MNFYQNLDNILYFLNVNTLGNLGVSICIADKDDADDKDSTNNILVVCGVIGGVLTVSVSIVYKYV